MYYNMVGVAAIMAIFNGHKIMARFAQCMEIFFKSSKIQSFLYLAVTMTTFIRTKQRNFDKFFLTKLTAIEIRLNSLKNTNAWFTKQTWTYFSHLNIFAFIFL